MTPYDTQYAEGILNKLAKNFKKTFAGSNIILQRFIIFFLKLTIRAWNQSARLYCLSFGFHALTPRILKKIFFKSLKNTLLDYHTLNSGLEMIQAKHVSRKNIFYSTNKDKIG